MVSMGVTSVGIRSPDAEPDDESVVVVVGVDAGVVEGGEGDGDEGGE